MSDFARIDEVMLWVQDLARSIAFYEQTLNIPVADRNPNYTRLVLAGTGIALRPSRSKRPIHAQTGPELVFRVADIHATHKRLADAGVPFDKPPFRPQPDRDVWLAFFHDPDGNRLQLVQG